MNDSPGGPRWGGLVGVVAVVVAAIVGFVLLTGDERGQLVASGIVMAGAVALGAVQGYRDRSQRSLIGAAALVVGGTYGAFLATAGRDPFTDGVVLALVVVGLVVGLFDRTGDDRAAEDLDGDEIDGGGE